MKTYWRGVRLEDPTHTLYQVPVRTTEVSFDVPMTEAGAAAFDVPLMEERLWRFTFRDRVPSRVKRGQAVRWYITFGATSDVLVGRVKYRYGNRLVLVGHVER